MRILFITNYYPPEIGAASHLFYELARELSRREHRVTVLTGFPRYNVGGRTFSKDELASLDARDNIRVVRVKTPTFRKESKIARGIEHFTVSALFALAGSLGKQDVALIYSPPLTLGLTGDFFRRSRGIPYIINVQDLFPQSAIDLGVLNNRLLVRMFEGIERYVYRRACFVTVHSEGNAEHVIRKGAPSGCVVVVPNWVNTNEIAPGERDNAFRRSAGYSPEDFVVSFAGTMGFSQDIDIVLEAAKHLSSIPRIKFLLVGDGVEKARLVEKAGEMSLGNLQFLPMQPKERYPEVLAASDVSLVTLKKEVLTPVVPSKLLSIMASGRPVIASMNLYGDAPTIIQRSGCGVCVPAGDAEEFAAAIRSLWENEAIRLEMGKRGREFVVREFSVGACASKYEELFRAAKREK
mgnify:CR=1 FL=1